MTIRRDSFTVALCAVLAVGALLACKKKKEESGGTATTDTAAATGATATTTAAPAPAKVYNVGDTATQIDYKLTVANVKECKKKGYYYSGPKKGNLWLGVEVTVESMTDKQFMPYSSQFKIADGEGTVTSPGYAMTKECDPNFSVSAALNKGEKAKGWLVFEVPEKSSGLKLSYEPTILFGTKQLVKFDLGR